MGASNYFLRAAIRLYFSVIAGGSFESGLVLLSSSYSNWAFLGLLFKNGTSFICFLVGRNNSTFYSFLYVKLLSSTRVIKLRNWIFMFNQFRFTKTMVRMLVTGPPLRPPKCYKKYDLWIFNTSVLSLVDIIEYGLASSLKALISPNESPIFKESRISYFLFLWPQMSSPSFSPFVFLVARST